MGYALPGTVLAVGIVVAAAFVDKHVAGAIAAATGFFPDSVFQGTVATVIFAYTVRFLTAGFNTIDSSMHRVTKSLDEASSILGTTGFELLAKVHAPILKRGLCAAAIIVFVDAMKEMPITLMTRPFGWDTLAVKIFELTSEGEWQRAALPSIMLVAAGLIPLVFLNGKSDRTSK
jgi:iron(III) transport system permease protein